MAKTESWSSSARCKAPSVLHGHTKTEHSTQPAQCFPWARALAVALWEAQADHQYSLRTLSLLTFITSGISSMSRKQSLPADEAFIGFLMTRFSGQDWIYLSTAMGFEAETNSKKKKTLQSMCNMGILSLLGQKNLLNLNISVTGILIERQDQATREGENSHRTVINIQQVSGHTYNYTSCFAARIKECSHFSPMMRNLFYLNGVKLNYE